MEPQEYDEIIRTLMRIAAHQDTINEDLQACVLEQREFNNFFSWMCADSTCEPIPRICAGETPAQYGPRLQGNTFRSQDRQGENVP